MKDVGRRGLASVAAEASGGLRAAALAQGEGGPPRLRRERRLVNASAVMSLVEGLEHTLTLHRLGLFEALGRSLKTTNCLESIMAQVGQRTDKVDHWRTSDQKQRWVGTALLDIEPRLRRIKGYRHLPLLRAALQRGTTTRAGNQEHVA